jgi:hypothetical protein
VKKTFDFSAVQRSKFDEKDPAIFSQFQYKQEATTNATFFDQSGTEPFLLALLALLLNALSRVVAQTRHARPAAQRPRAP